MKSSKPIVLVCTNKIKDGTDPWLGTRTSICSALSQVSEVIPLMIPSNLNENDIAQAMNYADGILLSGSVTNVSPEKYNCDASPMHEPYDHDRDNCTFSMIPLALKQEKPLLGICRGFQEINAALGGTLNPKVQNRPNSIQHHYEPVDENTERDVIFSLKHSVKIQEGRLQKILKISEIEVNSVHFQGINKLAPNLEIEALAPDGLIEAISVKEAPSFAMGFQWHPEYQWEKNKASVELFKCFGEHVYKRQQLND